jgi:molybdopterin-binding protein/molybdate transport repressor ModE-like protein
MNRRSVVTSTDVALLRALGESPSLAGAGRRIGISRDRAVYRIGRLSRAFGGPVVHSVRGGVEHGTTVLTPLGDRIVRGGFDSVELLEAHPVAPIERPNLLNGTYERLPIPTVRIGASLRLRVAFAASDETPVTVLLDPEAIVVARRRFSSSARNVLRGTVESLERRSDGTTVRLLVRCFDVRLRVAITEEPVRQLGLRPGVRVWLYVKATALRRVSRARAGPRSAA